MTGPSARLLRKTRRRICSWWPQTDTLLLSCPSARRPQSRLLVQSAPCTTVPVPRLEAAAVHSPPLHPGVSETLGVQLLSAPPGVFCAKFYFDGHWCRTAVTEEGWPSRGRCRQRGEQPRDTAPRPPPPGRGLVPVRSFVLNGLGGPVTTIVPSRADGRPLHPASSGGRVSGKGVPVGQGCFAAVFLTRTGSSTLSVVRLL